MGIFFDLSSRSYFGVLVKNINKYDKIRVVIKF